MTARSGWSWSRWRHAESTEHYVKEVHGFKFWVNTRPKFISLYWGEYSNDVTVKLDREFKQFGLVWVIKFGVAPGRKHEHRACIFDRVKVDNSPSTFFVVQEGFPINIQVALER